MKYLENYEIKTVYSWKNEEYIVIEDIGDISLLLPIRSARGRFGNKLWWSRKDKQEQFVFKYHDDNYLPVIYTRQIGDIWKYLIDAKKKDQRQVSIVSLIDDCKIQYQYVQLFVVMFYNTIYVFKLYRSTIIIIKDCIVTETPRVTVRSD